MVKTTALKNGKIGSTGHFDLQILSLKKAKEKIVNNGWFLSLWGKKRTPTGEHDNLIIKIYLCTYV